MSESLKKNCINCKFGYWGSEGDYGEYNYFVCDKREDDGYNNLDDNLSKKSYREKSKVCCELKELAKCNDCGHEQYVNFKPADDYLCFGCWYQNKELEQGVSK